MADKLAVKVTIKGKDDLSGKLKALESRLQVFKDRAKFKSMKAELFSHSALGKTIGGLKAVAGGAARLMGTLSKGLGLLGAASIGAAAGIYKVVSAQAKAMGAGSEFARLTGLSFEGLQELRYAADQSGVSAKEFDGALRKLNKGMGEFRTGKGELANFVKILPKDFQRSLKGTKNNEEALGLLFNALDRIKDPAKKAAFAAKFFGKTGDKIALMAAGGADAVKKLREEARKWGVASNEAGQNAEAFGDAQAKVSAATNGVRNVIAEKLLPTLTPMLERMAEYIAKNREIIGLKIAGVFQRIADALAAVDWAAVGRGIEAAIDLGTQLMVGFINFTRGVLTGDMSAAAEGIGQAWSAIKPHLETLWTWIKEGFKRLLVELGEIWAKGIRDMVVGSFDAMLGPGGKLLKRMFVGDDAAPGETRVRGSSALGRAASSFKRTSFADDAGSATAAPSPMVAPTVVPGTIGRAIVEVKVSATEGSKADVKAEGGAVKAFKKGATGVNTLLVGAGAR